MTDNLWKNWIISLLIVGVVSSLVQILIHGGKSERTVKKCTGIVLALAIISPLPVVFGKALNIDEALDYFYNPDSGYGEYTKDYLLDILSDKIKLQLSEQGITGAGVAIDATGSGAETEINFVIIKLPQDVIVGNDEHINKRKIINAVKEVISIEEDKIIIYE